MDLTDDEILAQQGQPGGEPAAAGAPAGAPSEPQFNPQEFAYKFRDQMVQPKDRNEVTELMQFGHSFRANKSKYEQDRQALQAYEAKKDVYRKYDDLSSALEANPDFRTELEQLAQKYSGQPKPTAQPGGLPPEVGQKLTALEQWKTNQEAKEADGELKRELDTLEQLEPTYDWKTDSGEGSLRQRLIQYMSKNQVYSPEIAFAGMMRKTDMQRVKFEAERKAADDAAKAKKLGVVAPGTQGAPSNAPASIDHKSKSYDDLENLALESLGRR